MTEAWTVLVCGDAARGDDGAALVALERLPRRIPASIQVRACGPLEPDELVAALLSGPCLVLDSVRGVEPGSVVELPLARLLSGDGPMPALSHALPMPIIVGLAEALGAPLGRGTFLGIGGASFGLGQPLSAAVEAGLPAYAQAIVDHLPRIRRAPDRGDRAQRRGPPQRPRWSPAPRGVGGSGQRGGLSSARDG